MGEDNKFVLSNAEIDAIGEILNISMGSAATAMSTLLDKQVIITTPNVSLEEFSNIDYSSLEPAMLVKIKYIEGISGSNVMLFRQHDMQLILNMLMGNDDPPADDFVFDELSMSAACEVMNQMMGASATALSEFLGKTINISTPTTYMVDSENTFQTAMEVANDEEVVSVSFNITIENVMNSEFVSIMTIELAKMIVSQAMGEQSEEPAPPEPVLAPVPLASIPMQPTAPAPAPVAPPAPAPAPPPAPAAAAPAAAPASPPPMVAQPDMGAYGVPPVQPGMMPGMPYGGYPPQMYSPEYAQQPAYPPQGYGYQPPTVMKQPLNVQSAQLPDFSRPQTPVFVQPMNNANMDLIMNVPLNVSVEIGKTKRKIRDIMDFNQGTVIELEKQAGAPVDIVVNGQLIARGDVVVIDDNFGVRITEIVGTKDLIEAIGPVL